MKNRDEHKVLLELTVFDLKNDTSGVHVYLPKDMSEEEFVTAMATMAKVMNSLTEKSLTEIQRGAAQLS